METLREVYMGKGLSPEDFEKSPDFLRELSLRASTQMRDYDPNLERSIRDGLHYSGELINILNKNPISEAVRPKDISSSIYIPLLEASKEVGVIVRNPSDLIKESLKLRGRLEELFRVPRSDLEMARYLEIHSDKFDLEDWRIEGYNF